VVIQTNHQIIKCSRK